MSWNPGYGGGGGGVAPSTEEDKMKFAQSGGQYGTNAAVDDYYGTSGGAEPGEAAEDGHGGGACRRCGDTTHEVKDCPEPDTRPCFNCGETGHRKDDCTNPAVFTGECRACNQPGHRANDCPNAPAKPCTNCDQDGHTIAECENPRSQANVFKGIPDEEPAKVWEELKTAVKERDMDDVETAFWKYAKGTMPNSYLQMEKSFRDHNMSIWIIALEKELSPTYSNMDLTGALGKKYTANLRFSPQPLRPKERDGWPESQEENLTRLADCGRPVDRGIIKCRNCDEFGHAARNCSEDKKEVEQIVVKCFNCSEVGHRVRDCPIDRVDKFACRNCKKSGHSSRECPEPRSAENVECKRCNETGHFAKDCPTAPPSGCRNCGQDGHIAKECSEPRNPATMTCRNCDEVGHVGKDCPKPRDYSRVKCSNCQEMGHTKVRCKQALVEDDDHNNAYNGSGDAGAAVTGFDGGAAIEATPAPAADNWASGGGAGGGGW